MPHPAPHIVFSGGGTGGHLFPGLAVAEHVRRRVPAARITFAGSGKPFERRAIEDAGFDYVALHCRSAPRRLGEIIPFVLENTAGYRAANRFLDSEAVNIVVGLGGYASVPMARAAVNRRVPLVLLEQNAVPGRATRWLARRAATICLALPNARSHLPQQCRIEMTGNPLRPGFTPTDPRQKQLLVLGGSGGARTLNERIPVALSRLRGELRDWRIVHQTGANNAAATQQLYQQLGIAADVVEFLADMPSSLRATGLAVCRAGGTTLAELAAAGVPAVLLPYPYAADDHQRRNAEVFSRCHATLLLDEREHVGQIDRALAQTIGPLLSDAAERSRLAAAMRQFARPDAAHAVAAFVLEHVPSHAANKRRRAG